MAKETNKINDTQDWTNVTIGKIKPKNQPKRKPIDHTNKPPHNNKKWTNSRGINSPTNRSSRRGSKNDFTESRKQRKSIRNNNVKLDTGVAEQKRLQIEKIQEMNRQDAIEAEEETSSSDEDELDEN